MQIISDHRKRTDAEIQKIAELLFELQTLEMEALN